MIRLEAKPAVAALTEQLRSEVTAFRAAHGRAPKLAVVLVGNNPASVIYTRRKGEAAVAVGIEHQTISLADGTPASAIRAEVEKLNRDDSVDGILIQRPTAVPESELVYWVSPKKDVDGFHPESVGRLGLGLPSFVPCTPLGVMKLLAHYQIPLAGKRACVVGRSSIVGKPMAQLLLQAQATVTLAHSQTLDLVATCRNAQVLVVAIGRPEFITADFVASGTVVIDVGINRTAGGKIVGDVDFESVSRVAHALTPVPGGVGPMTIAMLLANTLRAANARVATNL